MSGHSRRSQNTSGPPSRTGSNAPSRFPQVRAVPPVVTPGRQSPPPIPQVFSGDSDGYGTASGGSRHRHSSSKPSNQGSVKSSGSHATSRSHNPENPDLLLPIHAYPTDDFDQFIHWIADTFGCGRMFLKADYVTLKHYLEKELYAQTYLELRELVNVSPSHILQGISYNLAVTQNKELVELFLILHYIEAQFKEEAEFPWGINSYFMYRMLNFPTLERDFSPPEMTPRAPPYRRHSPHVSPDTPMDYEPTPPTFVDAFNSVRTYSYHEGGSQQPKPVLDRMEQDRNSPFRHKLTRQDSSGDDKSLGELSSSLRRRRNEAYYRYQATPKIRSNISSDKLQWDGHRSSFPTFCNDLEGSLIRIGLGYIFANGFQDLYAEEGLGIADQDDFWDTYRISQRQLKQDSEYLYGLLKSATKSKMNPIIMRNKSTRDGIKVWIAFQNAYAYGGSKKLRSNELEEKLISSYNPKAYKGISHYIDEFQSWVEELDGLKTRSYGDEDKKRMLIRNLVKVQGITHLLQTCEDRIDYDFDETCNYIRTNSMTLDKIVASTPRPTTMLNTYMEVDEPTVHDVMNRIQTMMSETSPIQVYNALRSPTMRDSLSIPGPLWKELEPQLRERIQEIRDQIRKKKEASPVREDKPAEKPKATPAPIPQQYGANHTTTMELVANLCANMELQDSEEDTDEDVFLTAFHSSTVEYRAHFEYVDLATVDEKIYAIADGGADACVVGKHAHVTTLTGRYAHLIGYDPSFTKSPRIPIVTAYLKVKADNGIPILLKINEAAYNANSPVTLISEYQVREHGYVIDSVATKHKSGPDTYGTQRIVLNDVIHVPFTDRGGLMGFEILPIEDGDINEVDPVYDVFELTSAQQWIPARFRANSTTTQELQSDTPFSIVTSAAEENPMSLDVPEYEDTVDSKKSSHILDSVDSILGGMSFDEIVRPKLEDTHEFFTFQSTRSVHFRPWHRVIPYGLDPSKLRRFLGWRPTEIIQKTLEVTTQLATSCIRYPMTRHIKSRNPHATTPRIDETVSTDPQFANCKSLFHGYIGSQTYFGITSKMINVYGFRSKGEFPQNYRDFIREEGAPSALRRDNAPEEKSQEILDIHRQFAIKDQWSEAYNQQQNPVEGCAIRWLKSACHGLLDRTGAPPSAWYFALRYLADVHNFTYDKGLGMTPYQRRHGTVPDISAFLQHGFWDPILYLDHEDHWPATKERPGRWLGVAHNVGDILTYWILDDQTKRVLARSVVRPNSENRRVSWDPALTTEPRYTARSDSPIPSLATREHLLANSMDRYDADEPDILDHPEHHDDVTHSHEDIAQGDEQEQAPGQGEYTDTGPTFDSLLVPMPTPDPYQGPSLLRFDNVPMDLDPNIVTPPVVGKKHPLDVEYGQPEYIPEEPEPSPIHTKPRRSARLKKKEHTTVEVRTANRTTWVPTRARKAFKVAALGIGLTLLPNRVCALPTIGMIKVPPPTTLTSSSELLTPMKSTPNMEKLRAYHAVLDRWNSYVNPDPENERWRIKRIVRMSHRTREDGTPSVFFKIQFFDGPRMWLTMDQLRIEDPYLVIEYARTNKHTLLPGFEWIQQYWDQDDEVRRILTANRVSNSADTKKFKFGHEVPRNPKHALELDKLNGNTLWADSIKLELDQIMSYEVFRVLQDWEALPPGYKRIPYHIIHDVKFDGRRKSRLVAGGHRAPEVEKEDRYSPVVSNEGVRIGFCMADLNSLLVCAADVGNAFLYGITYERVYIIAGPEFGPELEGKRLLIVKSLYGLASSAARYHEHCSRELTKLGFQPSKADPDLWFRWNKGQKCYEYIARYVDDLMVFAKDPMDIMNKLQEVYVLKGVGTPRYYLGGDVLDLNEHWAAEGQTRALSAQTYIQNCLPKLAEMLNMDRFPRKNTPLDEAYHPELDDSELCCPVVASKYRSMIGSANWILTLGRFDIAYALSTLARYSMAPRKGHFIAMVRLFGYLSVYDKGMLVIDSTTPEIRKEAIVSSGHNWSEFYPDAIEEVPSDMPEPDGEMMKLTCYVDADHARDKLTRKSVTGIVLLLNNTPISWMSKRQKTVETSTYGSELVAARIAVDLIVEWRYKLRMLGVELEESSWMVGDNMSVVVNTTIPSSNLKKKHQACNYHRVREAIAGRFITYGYIPSERNIADICTKPLGGPAFHALTNEYLFRKPRSLVNAKKLNEGE